MVKPTRNELLKELVDYTVLATGLPREKVIKAKQNAPSPLGNYCTIQYVTEITSGTANIDISEDVSDATKLLYDVRGKRYYTYSVQFYRIGAADLARDFLMFHNFPAGKEFIQTSLFTFRRINSIDGASIQMSQNYEERAVLNLEIIVAETAQVKVTKVAKVPIDATLDAEATLTTTFEVQ